MDDELKKLLDAPLKNPLGLNLPKGKRPAKRGPRARYSDEIGDRLSQAQLRQKRQEEYSSKIVSLLDYYAATTVPFERVAAHTGLDVETIGRAMARRGRMS